MKLIAINVIDKLNIKHSETMDDFISEFQARECNAFLHNPEIPSDKEDIYCYCSRPKSWHIKNHIPSVPGKNWINTKHTRLIPCNAYGKMRMQGYGRIPAGLKPNYIRIDSLTTNFEQLWTVLTEKWQMPEPTLILSVNGGAKKMIPLSQRLQSAFKRGIIDVASSTPTWIITGGYHFGIAKLVGEAANEYMTYSHSGQNQMAVIGIAAWGALYGRDNLLIHNCINTKIGANNSTHLANYYNSKNEPGEGQTTLDPYHTHFLFADDGTERLFGKEIPFRVKFAEFAAQKMTQMQKASASPVVQLLVEGGKNAILTCGQALESNTPIVVMQGSGRAADIICSIVSEIDSDTSDEAAILKINFHLDKYEEDWQITPNEKISMTKDLLGMTRQHRPNIHIFNIDGVTKNLDRAILRAVFKSCRNVSTQVQLDLAMSMNRMDMAQQEIFSDRNRFKRVNLDLESAMTKALELNLVDFVKLFLANGVSIKTYLTKKRINKLYEFILKHEQNQGAELFREMYESTVSSFQRWWRPAMAADNSDFLFRVGKLFSDLTGESIDNPYNYPDRIDPLKRMSHGRFSFMKRAKSNTPLIVEELQEVPNTNNSNKDGIDNEAADPHSTPVKSRLIYPPYMPHGDRIYTEQDLFFWALLTNRLEMARLFWQLGKDHMGSALVANGILKQLAEKAAKKGEQELLAQLEEEALAYEEIAIGILSKSYSRDKILTHLLLVRSLPYYNNLTCLALANQNGCMDFLHHTACQTKLNSIWMGGMHCSTAIWKLLLNLVFAVFFIRLIFPRRVDSGDSKDESVLDPTVVSTTAPNARELLEYLSANIRLMKMGPGTQNEFSLESYRTKQSRGFQQLSYIQSIKLFYTAPVIKFTSNMISYVIFLCLLSYMVLIDLKPFTPESPMCGVEVMVWIWVFTLIVAELRQVFGSAHVGFTFRLRIYLSNSWNIFDLIVYGMFIFAVLLRCALSTETFVWARRAHTVVLSMFYIRFMQFYYANKFIGPKVVMIRRMLNDVFFFVCIYIIFVLAYGTMALAMHNPAQKPSWAVLKDVLYSPYWATYGELGLEGVEGSSSCKKGDSTCSQYSPLAILAFALFMLFTNVLLVNLLIAMFGNTFEAVQSSSEKVWAFNRYDLIYEFFERPFLAPPFIVLLITWRFFKSIYLNYHQRGIARNKIKKAANEFTVFLDDHDNSQMCSFVHQCTEMYMNSEQLFNGDDDIVDKMENVIERVSMIQKTVENYDKSDLDFDVKSEISSLKRTVSAMESKLDNISELMIRLTANNKN